MVEIEVVDLETIDDGPEPEPVPASESEPEPESKSEPPPDSEPESEPEPQPEDVEVVTGHDVPQPVAEVFVVTGEPTGADDQVRPPESAEPVDPLPTMVDLDRVASELDDIDARLASLDEQRP